MKRPARLQFPTCVSSAWRRSFPNGRDRVTVFAGAIEVRTPSRTTRLRSGDSATIDDRGLYDLAGDQRESADEFERWFLKRADRFDNVTLEVAA